LFCQKFGVLSRKLGIDNKNHYFLNRIGFLVMYMLVSRQLDHYNRAQEKALKFYLQRSRDNQTNSSSIDINLRLKSAWWALALRNSK